MCVQSVCFKVLFHMLLHPCIHVQMISGIAMPVISALDSSICPTQIDVFIYLLDYLAVLDMHAVLLVLIWISPNLIHGILESAKELREDEGWGNWSPCSSSCGKGVRTRFRKCNFGGMCAEKFSQSKDCFLSYCPGYLSWPRIHFSGKILADVNTVNNIRCAYDNNEFYPAQLSKRYIGLGKQSSSHVYYKFETNNWNPDGTNQMYFVNTFVTSFCAALGKCTTDDPIVGLKVQETSRGIMAVLDVDWQKSTEIWGLKIRIPGILDAAYKISSHQGNKARLDAHDQSQGYAISNMSRYKSKLYNITWYDNHYKSLFHNANELSMAFTIDLFDQKSFMGRITGTIGTTSVDDPLQTTATRILQEIGIAKNKDRGSAPFYIHFSKRAMVIDFSFSVGGLQNGSITSRELGQLDLGAFVPICRHCRNMAWKRMTVGGKISKIIGESNDWYKTYGGVMEIDLSHLEKSFLRLIAKSRIGVLNSLGQVYLAEFPMGITYGFIQRPIIRMNVGDTEQVQIFVSSFGKPVLNAQVNLYLVKGETASSHCASTSCNSSLGVPASSLGISSNKHIALTNRSGVAVVELLALKDPGTVRGCGLDGQLYPLQIFVRYRHEDKTWTFSDSEETTTGSIHSALHSTNTFSAAARIYNAVREKYCPVWEDVKEIFLQYYNLYPVMWKTGIINLHSYDDIKTHAKMLMVSMFDTAITDSRYMPMSRDLSKGRKTLIFNWIKCGMLKQKAINNDKSSICDKRTVNQGILEVQSLLEKALMLELSTIPPYMTAWLSLKTEFGRNMEIAKVLKSVFVEEMLHMSLAGNILNAIRGTVNLTDERRLPSYPTILATGEGYQILPNVEVAIAPFSIGLVDDVFSAIEKPSDSDTKKLMQSIGYIWKFMYKSESNGTTKSMQNMLNEISRDENDQDSLNLSGALPTFGSQDKSSKYDAWAILKKFAEDKLRFAEEQTMKNVGQFYTILALKLTRLEACAKISSSKKHGKTALGTIFQGNESYQLDMSHWYQRSFKSIEDVMSSYREIQKDESREKKALSPLFKVTDLKSALQAIVEIVYQGEGGSQCSPFVTEPNLYSSLRGRDQGFEFSHYYRFLEIVHGRKLIKTDKFISCEQKCLDYSDTKSCTSNTMRKQHYCFSGQRIPFHADGVWPIIFNPQNNQYLNTTKAYRLNEQFNLLYTRLLFCLQDAFGGNPHIIKKCMSTMYDMTITGKRLVQTPIAEKRYMGKPTYDVNGSPTWSFVREKPYRAGLPRRT